MATKIRSKQVDKGAGVLRAHDKQAEMTAFRRAEQFRSSRSYVMRDAIIRATWQRWCLLVLIYCLKQ